MADAFEPIDETNLIDVSDVQQAFDESTVTQQEATDRHRLPELGTPGLSPQRIASWKDRLAASCIDAGLLFLMYWIAATVYSSVAFDRPAVMVPTSWLHGLLFHGLFAVGALLFFTLAEGAFAASPGKACCRLRVRMRDGEPVGFGAAFLRTLFLPFDIVLACCLLGIVLMEKTAFRQRLGDLIAGTVVVAHRPRVAARAISPALLASASGRIGAGVVDALLVLAFAGGYALLLSPETPIASSFFVLCAPFALVGFIALPELFLETSPGKWIFGYRLCHEDGTPITLATSLMRTVLLIVDATPFGLLSILLSPRRQRIGDAIAATVVIRARREIPGLVGSLALIALVGAVLFAGLENRDNFLHPGFRINFLPALDGRSGGLFAEATPRPIAIEDVRLSPESPQSPPREPAAFRPGERISIVFQLTGYARKNHEAWLIEDMVVRYPDNAVALKVEKMIEFRKKVETGGPIEFVNHIDLPLEAPLGRYSFTITIRDVHSDRRLTEQRSFVVTDFVREEEGTTGN